MAIAAPADSRADAMTPVPHRVVERVTETHDTVTLTLEPVAEPLAAAVPGQFTMVRAFGVGEVPISVSALPGDGRVVHTIRAVGSVTRALCAAQPGTLVGLRGPFGTGWRPEDATRDVALIVGGLGLAPLRPVVHDLLARGQGERRAVLLVGARTPEELIFAEELEAWRFDPRLEVHVTVDRATTAWHGTVGVVTKLLDRVALSPASTTVMICGPEIMMRFAAAAVLDLAIPAERVWVSLERTMQCGIGRCGHCMLAGLFMCADGPVIPWAEVAPMLGVREL